MGTSYVELDGITSHFKARLLNMVKKWLRSKRFLGYFVQGFNWDWKLFES